MVAAAVASRPRPNPAPSRTQKRRSMGTWVIIGIPVLLALTLAWQIGSSFVHSEIAVRGAVAVSRVKLESDPAGARIDLVLVDRVGQETTVNGEVNIKLREPDGTLWQVNRHVAASDFTPIVDGGLLGGRLGYSVIVPATDWIRAPRHGGAATVTVSVEPTDGQPFSTVAEERFP